MPLYDGKNSPQPESMRACLIRNCPQPNWRRIHPLRCSCSIGEWEPHSFECCHCVLKQQEKIIGIKLEKITAEQPRYFWDKLEYIIGNDIIPATETDVKETSYWVKYIKPKSKTVPEKRNKPVPEIEWLSHSIWISQRLAKQATLCRGPLYFRFASKNLRNFSRFFK